MYKSLRTFLNSAESFSIYFEITEIIGKNGINGYCEVKSIGVEDNFGTEKKFRPEKSFNRIVSPDTSGSKIGNIL